MTKRGGDEDKRVRAFLAQAKGAVSEGDVVAGTGVDVGSVKRALYALMRSHQCALQVRADGTLVYDFGRSLVPLGKPSWGDRLRTLGRWAWKGFSFLYKASLAVVLVTYAVTFLVIIVAMAIAASIASEDGSPAEGAFHLVAAVFRGIFEFATFMPVTYELTDRHGYRHAHYEPKKPVFKSRKEKEHAKSFVASVYDFVLGPKRVEVDHRAQHREVAAFVRTNRGVLTVSDVQALSGMDRASAERFFALFVAEAGGEAEVTEEGALYARFDELMRSKDQRHDERIVHYWDEYEPPHELTGNPAGKNVIIALIAAFNLLCSLFFLSHGLAFVWLGAIPALIFSLFFAIPMIRAPVVWWSNRKQHAENIRKRFFKAIFAAEEEQLSFQEVVARANRNATTEERLVADELRSLLEATLREVGGELDVKTRDGLVMNLERLRAEAKVGAEQAKAAPAKVEEAEVVYETV